MILATGTFSWFLTIVIGFSGMLEALWCFVIASSFRAIGFREEVPVVGLEVVLVRG